MNRISVTAILLVLLAAVSAWGDGGIEAPRPGEAIYLVVLGDGAAEPDVAAMGGRVLKWWSGRRIVAVSPEVAGALRKHAGVSYMQRIWTGEAIDPAVTALRTPVSVTPAAAPPAWSTGIYQYDSSGNIKSMGTDSFAYDAVGRVVRSTVQGQLESYTFDPYGNLRQLGNIALTVNEATNRLTEATDRITAFAYDGVGNMTGDGRGRTYHYDALGMVTAIDVAGTDTIVHDLRMIYTADDERIVISEGPTTRFRVRDYGARVLREWKSTGEVLEWERDYLYADGDLVAGEVQVDQQQNGMRHYHKDHLGSTRMVTDGAGELVARHDYRPFGAEFPPTTTEYANTGKGPRDPKKFTGHERDYFSVANVEGEYVDYMHARYYSPGWGRFLSVDPVLGTAAEPQSWNRYVYVANNPVNKTDPDGRCAVPGACPEPERATREQTLWNSFKENFVPEIPSADNPLVLDPKNRPVETWINVGKIAAVVSPIHRMLSRPSVLVFRVFGGRAGQFGRSWTRVDPTNVANYRGAAGLPNANTGEYVTTGVVKVKDINKVTKATPIDGNAGGVDEVIIENAKKAVKVIKTKKVDPPV